MAPQRIPNNIDEGRDLERMRARVVGCRMVYAFAKAYNMRSYGPGSNFANIEIEGKTASMYSRLGWKAGKMVPIFYHFINQIQVAPGAFVEFLNSRYARN